MTTAIISGPKIGCEDCDFTGFLRQQIDGVMRCVRCPCFRAQYLTAPGVPLEFKDATLANFIERPGNAHALADARAWQKRGEGDLFLQGGVGAGKTRLAVSLLNEHYQQARSGLFLRTAKLMLDIQTSFRDQATDEDRRTVTRTLAKVESEPLIVLDDLGVEKGSDFTRRTLLTIYEARHDQGLRTIWTSNYSLDWIEDVDGFADARLASRIAGRATVVEITCGDWRVPSAREEKD